LRLTANDSWKIFQFAVSNYHRDATPPPHPHTVKNIGISTDILWRLFPISAEPVPYTFASVNRRNDEARAHQHRKTRHKISAADIRTFLQCSLSSRHQRGSEWQASLRTVAVEETGAAAAESVPILAAAAAAALLYEHAAAGALMVSVSRTQSSVCRLVAGAP